MKTFFFVNKKRKKEEKYLILKLFKEICFVIGKVYNNKNFHVLYKCLIEMLIK